MTAPVRSAADFAMNHDPRQSVGFGMIHALQRKAIRLTGAPRSVFSQIEALEMQDLKKLYDSRDDEALKAQITVLRGEPGLSAEKSAALDAWLLAAERRQEVLKLELAQLTTAVQSGDFYKASQMIATMDRAGIAVPEDLRAMTDGQQQAIEQGEKYMSIMRRFMGGPATFTPKDCIALAAMAEGDDFYAAQARQAMIDYAVPADGIWPDMQLAKAEVVPAESVGQLFYLISPSLDEVKTMRMKSWVTEVGAPHPVDDLVANPDLKGWYTPAYDDTDWPRELGPYLIQEKRGDEHEAHILQRYEFVAKYTREIDSLFLKARFGPRGFRGTIYLNGEAVVEFVKSPGVRGRSRGHRRLG